MHLKYWIMCAVLVFILSVVVTVPWCWHCEMWFTNRDIITGYWSHSKGDTVETVKWLGTVRTYRKDTLKEIEITEAPQFSVGWASENQHHPVNKGTLFIWHSHIIIIMIIANKSMNLYYTILNHRCNVLYNKNTVWIKYNNNEKT